MTRARGVSLLRLAAGAAVLVAVVAVVGHAPVLEGLRRTTPAVLAVALVVTALTTGCCAWRWSLLAGRLGVPVPLGDAVRACYGSQLLNVALPGGILGDAHRAAAHARASGAVLRGAASVAGERTAGQLVQIVLSVAVLLVLPSPWRPDPAWALPAAAAVLVLGVAGLLVAGGIWPRVALASTVAVAGHATVLVVVARSVGVDLPVGRLVPLAAVVLLAAALPLNVAGWGPREGAAAWAFHAAGLDAATGLTVSVAYGVAVLVSTLPGLLVLLPRRAPATLLPGPAGPAAPVGEVRRG